MEEKKEKTDAKVKKEDSDNSMSEKEEKPKKSVFITSL